MSDLGKLVREAMDRFNALSPEQQAEHRRAQRESFIRGMSLGCEHGVLDFEQCVECRAAPQADYLKDASHTD